jgi:hypothetical protein
MRPVKRDKRDVEGAGEAVWEGSEGVLVVVGFSVWTGLEGVFEELYRRFRNGGRHIDDRLVDRGQVDGRMRLDGSSRVGIDVLDRYSRGGGDVKCRRPIARARPLEHCPMLILHGELPRPILSVSMTSADLIVGSLGLLSAIAC